ncbi:MAG: 5-oxoprolinase subunit PxpA [Pseudomonadota bacterium]
MEVDLNADMGESFGPWVMGDDESLLKIVSSANIACGAHAGDPDVMAKTMRVAKEDGVGIGAHPGFADLAGFGRNRMQVPLPSLQNSIRCQIGASLGMAKAIGAEVRHVKIHGALANMCTEDEDLARGCFEAVLSVVPDTIIMVLAQTAQERAAKSLGCLYATEIFADRAYNDDATLVDRRKEGAVIHDSDVAGERMVNMVKAGAIITDSGKHIPTPIDTICLHGDTPAAVQIAGSVREALQAAGVSIKRFAGRR